MKRFENKVCYVTGAGSGIGKATAISFAKEGGKVVCCDINKQNAEATVSEIVGLNGIAMAIEVNIANREQVENSITKTVEVFGRLDCAANCAGIAGPVSLKIHEYPEEYWMQQIAVNLTGNWYLLKYQIAQMLKNGGGNIAILSSAAGLIGQPANSPYAASKHGIEGLMKTAAIEYATQNIRINSICPTAIETPMIMQGRRKLAENEEAKQQAINFQRMKRMGTPQEVADVALWLCSDQSSFITGSSIKADGGALA
ncbi:SDR family NAD(P)-dependent oxidoreductase [Lacihabitans sp. CS3-21]|uniref:SDR family NAD(P)-dependent oxidoreductase n=1 Tax=Lacihabitans sp. CS3-21 TaxID=2487332 RepID=UPI0020CFA921|nr:SDR family oxidoreductase [Lacihabitans sp. CS3-21]MCP9746793.1 SDR family oxidoreductase [Lacihabitans sp. CS3-21]